MSLAKASIDLVLPVGQRDHIQGSLIAPIVLVEYGDYQCPYCLEAVETVRELQQQFGERLCYVFRHFPIIEIHPHAIRAAAAAEAAAAQNQFWQMHYCLFSYQSDLRDKALVEYARSLELDMDKFQHDLNSSDRLHHIQEDIKTGVESGIDSTPTFFINGVHHFGNSDVRTLLKVIDQDYPN